jgi:hypothetical protein
MSDEPKPRTQAQNRCMHQWLTEVASTLNSAGMDMKRTLKPAVEIPWTGSAAKEHLWRPIQRAIANVESTTDISTTESIMIAEIITRHLGQSLGVQLPPWPTQQNGGGREEA